MDLSFVNHVLLAIIQRLVHLWLLTYLLRYMVNGRLRVYRSLVLIVSQH